MFIYRKTWEFPLSLRLVTCTSCLINRSIKLGYCKTGKFHLRFIFAQFALRGRGRIQHGDEHFEEIYDHKFRPTIRINAATETRLTYCQILTSSSRTIVFSIIKTWVNWLQKHETFSNSNLAYHI